MVDTRFLASYVAITVCEHGKSPLPRFSSPSVLGACSGFAAVKLMAALFLPKSMPPKTLSSTRKKPVTASQKRPSRSVLPSSSPEKPATPSRTKKTVAPVAPKAPAPAAEKARAKPVKATKSQPAAPAPAAEKARAKPVTTTKSAVASAMDHTVHDRGIQAPDPHEDLEGWAKVVLTALHERAVMGLLDLKQELQSHQDSDARGGDEVDISAQRDEHATRMRAASVLQERIKEVDAALLRLKQGEYGYCADTGEPIPVERLRANPLATRTVEAQQRLEIGARQFFRTAA